MMASENHAYNIPERGVENWDELLNENFKQLDIDVEIRDQDENRGEYLPKEGSKFFAVDTGSTYIGNGNEWEEVNNGNIGTVGGVGRVGHHVGAFSHGEYTPSENNWPGTDRWGIHFWAEAGLSIHTVVVDVDLTETTLDTQTVELRDVTGSTDEGAISTSANPVATSTIGPLEDGPQRVDLGFEVPSDGEWFLTVEPEIDTGGGFIQHRYSGPNQTSWNGWNDYTFDHINLIQGGRADDEPSYDWSETWFYFFDWEIGEMNRRVLSPWSHDVDEIYMRPRDPTEEFDVSPRALWIDTS